MQSLVISSFVDKLKNNHEKICLNSSAVTKTERKAGFSLIFCYVRPHIQGHLIVVCTWMCQHNNTIHRWTQILNVYKQLIVYYPITDL